MHLNDFWIPLVLISSGVLAAESTPKELYNRARPSVVLLVACDREGKPLAQGSGFAVGEGDRVVTNYHVVSGADRVIMKSSDGSESSISIVSAIDKSRDLAVLISDHRLPPVSLSRDEPEIGDNVIAVGNPHGLEATLSQGVISGVRGQSENLVYQITAPISAGSSGGPVINGRGEAIGVAAFTFKDGQNLNFAVPAKFVQPLLQSKQRIALTEVAPHLNGFQQREMEVLKLIDAQLFSVAVQKGIALIEEGDTKPEFLLILGLAALRADENGLAAKLFEQAVVAAQSQQLRAKAWGMLIFAYSLQGKYDQALHAYDASGMVQQVDGKGLLQLYLTQVSAGDTQAAGATASRILGLPDGRTWLQHFLSLDQEQRTSQAQRSLRDLIERNLRSAARR